MIDDKEESNISDDLKDVYHRLEKQLQNQLEKCKNMRCVGQDGVPAMALMAT